MREILLADSDFPLRGVFVCFFALSHSLIRRGHNANVVNGYDNKLTFNFKIILI
jgi:hypothetical protein